MGIRMSSLLLLRLIVIKTIYVFVLAGTNPSSTVDLLDAALEDTYVGTAMPDCPNKCGNVTIPYPFGLRSGCYVEGFAISCNQSKPYLLGLEVLAISLRRNYVIVQHPVIFSNNCNRTNFTDERRSVDLRRSNFWFSDAENVFAAVGCDYVASISNIDNITIGGCLTLCNTHDENSYGKNSCSGINCCRASLPANLQVFRTNLATVAVDRDKENPHGNCEYAFLVFSAYFSQLECPFKVQDMTHVPAVLEWALNANQTDPANCYNHANISNEDFGGFIGSWDEDSTKACRCWHWHKGDGYYPSDGYKTSPQWAFEGFRCWCEDGYEGNPYIPNGCEGESKGSRMQGQGQGKDKAKMVTIGVSSGFGGLFLLLGAWWLYKVIKRRREMKRKKKFFKRNGGLLIQQELSSSNGNIEKTKVFNSRELEKATDNYNKDRTLGKGGQGTVYKGMLSDGRIVAVKKSEMIGEGRVEQFINEVVILSQINHRSVVKLIGCCLETEVPLLVYEFIPNGTLFQLIHDANEDFSLTWEVRLRIAVEIAEALSYLHNKASTPIYHRDIKSSNILLDDKYKAKVSDFGTSRSITLDHTHLTTIVQGTFGYLDPEYFYTHQLTNKSDVYSFGVVVVELLTGLKAITSTEAQEGRSLALYFSHTMEKNRLVEILDARIEKDASIEQMIAVAHLARRCLNMEGKNRPPMKEVAYELEAIRMGRKEVTSSTSAPHQNFKKIEFSTTDLSKTWEITSFSAEICSDIEKCSSFDIKPLLLNTI